MVNENCQASNSKQTDHEEIAALQDVNSKQTDLQTQDQERQLMSVEDTDLERQHVNQQQSQTDSTPGIEGSHEEEEQSVRQEHEAQMQNSLTVSREIEPDEDQHANQQQTTQQQITLSTPHWGSDSNSSIEPMPVEAQVKNICPSGIEFDGDHEFKGIQEFPLNFACVMCESGTSETPYRPKCFRCMHCDILVCQDCYEKYENSYYLRHPESAWIPEANCESAVIEVF